MKHLKNEVNMIAKGVECGLSLEDHTIIPQVGDVIICYKLEKVPQHTEWSPGF